MNNVPSTKTRRFIARLFARLAHRGQARGAAFAIGWVTGLPVMLGGCETREPTRWAPTITTPAAPAPEGSAGPGAAHESGSAAPAGSAALVAPPLPSVSAPVAPAAPTELAPPTRKAVRVAAMGDSLTDPKSHGGLYLGVLRERCKESSFESFGVGGNMVNMMKRRFVRDVYKGAPEGGDFTHLILLGGLGDILSNETAHRTTRSITRDMQWMIDEAHRRGAKVIVMQLPPWGGFKAYDGPRAQMTREVSEWISGEAKAGRIEGTLATKPLLGCGQNEERLCPELSVDGIHWSKEGHRRVGEALFAEHFSDCR